MSLAQDLKEQTAGVAFKSHKFGVRRKLDQATRVQAAAPFNAEPDFLVASKCLLDTRSEPYRAVVDVITRARRYWKSITVFFPVKGVRLIRRDLMDQFDQTMRGFAAELKTATDALLEEYKPMKNKARKDLGQLYNPSDYPDPDTLLEEFSISWSYPSVDPPNFLKQLNPKLYEQEQARVAARFQEAMAAAEQTLAAEMQQIVSHLVDRLSPNESGGRRKLNEKAMSGLAEFVQRINSFSVHTSPDLDALVKQIEKISQGVDVQQINANEDAQKHLFSTVATLKDQLDAMLVDAPDRKIELED